MRAGGANVLRSWVGGIAVLLCLPLPGATGVVTWIHPADGPGGLRVESAVAGAAAALIAEDGRAIGTADDLAAAGWRVAADGLWETPPRSGGRRLTVSIEGLPAGTHRVYLRYFSQPRVPGNEWWYITQAGVADGKAQGLDHRAGTVIRGVGGYDPTTVYEASLGNAGTEQAPVPSLTIWFQRYEWSQVSRVGSIRIETVPSMEYATTQDPTAENDAARAALLAHGPPAEAGPRAYGYAVVSGTLKVRPKSFASLRGRQLGGEIEMAAARGEYESRQVLLYAPVQDLSAVRLAASPLIGPGGARIASENLLFAPVGYCPYAVPEDLGIHGYWPEPILTFLESFTVRQHDVQSLWFRVRVPADTPPGQYEGTVTVQPANAPASVVPVRLTVWELDTPAMSNLRVVVGCNRSDTFEMSYKLNPSTIYGFQPESIREFPAWAERGATAINLGYIAGAQIKSPDRLPDEAQLAGWVRDVGDRLAAAEMAGLKRQCYLYMFDEAKAEWTPAMRRIAAAFKTAYPDLPLLTTAHRAWWAGGSVKDGGETIDGIDWWCPLLPHYDPAAAAEARRHGKQVWWYTCNSPQKPFPNVMMTNPLMDIRLLMGLMAFAYRTDGFLYYATAGGYYAGMPAIKSGPYTAWRIEDNAHNHLYQKGPGGPLPSLRLEALRDGLEDYDLLHRAAALREALRQAGIETAEIRRLDTAVAPLSNPGNDLVRSLTDYTDDPAKLEEPRRRLAEYCVLASRALAQRP